MNKIDTGSESYQIIKFDSFEEFYCFFNSFHKSGIYIRNYIFRGTSKCDYSLLPRIMRNEVFEKHVKLYPFDALPKNTVLEHMCIELYLLYKFYLIANRNSLIDFNVDDFNVYDKFKSIRQLVNDTNQNKNIIWIPNKYYQIASLAQHYSIPTRLLDWTRDINIAIYFALRNSIDKIKNCTNEDFAVVWMLNTIFFTSNYRPDINIKIIEPSYLSNSYIKAQKGLFTLDELNVAKEHIHNKHISMPLEDKIIEIDINKYGFQYPLLYKLCIPYRDVNQGLFFLYNKGYDNMAIYPSLNEVANTIYDENMIINSMDNAEVMKKLFY